VGGSHGSFHIVPWGIDAFGDIVGALVDQVVQEHQAKVGHPDLICIGIGKRQLDLHRIPVFNDAVPLLPDIAPGLLDMRQ
jgi:hypothetical protein